MIEYKVVINATVLMDKTTRDASFNVGINGVKALYNNGSDLSFNVDATQDCFLYVFHKTKDNYKDAQYKLNELIKKSTLNPVFLSNVGIG